MAIRWDRSVEAVVLYDYVMYNRTGNVGRWANALMRRYGELARAFAPVGEGGMFHTRHGPMVWRKPGNRLPVGSLKGGISTAVERRGLRVLGMSLSIDAYYAGFVIFGTGAHGPGHSVIESQSARPMRIPVVPNKAAPKGWVSVSMVRGQRPNDFLDRAHRGVAARHPSIRGLERSAIMDPAEWNHFRGRARSYGR